MKRIIVTVLSCIIALVALKAQTVEPFDVKILHETEFTLTEWSKKGHQYNNLHVYLLKKGVHVKVLQQGSLNVGKLRVALDDGSIGWIPSEAVCESAEVKIHGSNMGPGDVTYRTGDKCVMEHKIFSKNSDRMFPTVYDEDGDPVNVDAVNFLSDVYDNIYRSIFNNDLPEAYRHLPVYEREYTTFYTIGHKAEKVNNLCGYSKEKVDSLLGTPEGYAGPGLFDIKGYTAAYYERYVSTVNSADFPGLLVVYNSQGLVRATAEAAHLKINNPSKIKVEVITLPKIAEPNADLEKALVKTYNRFRYYRDNYTSPDQTYGVPEVVIAPTEVYSSHPVRRKYIDLEDTFWSTLIRLVLMFFILRYALEKLPYIHYSKTKRLAIMILLTLVLFPWPFESGFWGVVGMLIGGFFGILYIKEFIRASKESEVDRCPQCGSWDEPYIDVLRTWDFQVNEKPEENKDDGRIKINTSGPFFGTRSLGGNDSETTIDIYETYMLGTTVTLEYMRKADKTCRNCHHKWCATEQRYETIRGPILFRTYNTRTHEWYDVTKVNGVEVERKENGYTGPRESAGGTFDYDRWHPYLNRYIRGESGALDEYYKKYFK